MEATGSLGGMRWECTAHSYRIINEKMKNGLGELHLSKSIEEALLRGSTSQKRSFVQSIEGAVLIG